MSDVKRAIDRYNMYNERRVNKITVNSPTKTAVSKENEQGLLTDEVKGFFSKNTQPNEGINWNDIMNPAEEPKTVDDELNTILDDIEGEIMYKPAAELEESGPFIEPERKEHTKYTDKLYAELVAKKLIPEEFLKGIVTYTLKGEVVIVTKYDVFDLQNLIERYVAGEIVEDAPEDNEKTLRPSYYGGKDNPFELFKVLRAWDVSFFVGNIIKYVVRAGKKNPETHLEDLEKALTYLQDEISAIKEAKKNKV